MADLPVSSNERNLAALAHAGIVVPGLGLIAPLIIWSSHREKSAFLSFQALQALAYQLLQMVFYFILYLLVMVISMSGMFAMFAIGGIQQNNDWIAAGTIFQVVLIFGLIKLMLLYSLGGVIAAILCLIGKPVRYPLLGKWLERFLAPDIAESPEAAHAD